MTEVELDEIEVLELESDDRGRVNLKTKYADATVQIAVLDAE